MIKSKEDYKEYLKADLIMTHIYSMPFYKHLTDVRHAFYKSLRLTEYYTNCRKDVVGSIVAKFLRFRHKRLCNRLQWTIPINVFGKGLCIVHRGTIVVSQKAVVGDNCRIHVCVNIGDAVARGREGAPTIGNNVYIGPGVKIFGGVTIGDDVAIGANAVVNDSFPEGHCTLAGVPARVISNNTSAAYISPEGT